MSEPMKLIVDGYLTVRDHRAIEELRDHKQKLKILLRWGCVLRGRALPVANIGNTLATLG